MWRERIRNLCPVSTFAPGCSSAALTHVEQALGIAFPTSLREILLESDGVQGEYGLGLIWPADRIRQDNLAFRTQATFAELYMPFDSLLFFADAGNGDQFAFSIQGGAIGRADIFAWDHETDSRTWVAPNIETYLDWWLTLGAREN